MTDDATSAGTDAAPSVAVFAPTTHLSVTIESSAGVDEVHIHPAGQGYWVARMLRVLGDRPVLCTPVGGETGTALRSVLGALASEGLVESSVPNGAYVHDRRGGQRSVIAHVGSQALDRHTADDLVSAVFAAALSGPVAVVCGSNLDGNIDASVFTRICHDVRKGGTPVVADLSGEELEAALSGGVDVLKISHEELVAGKWARGPSETQIVNGMRALREAGARGVVVSRAAEGSLAHIGRSWYCVKAPEMTVVDPRGAGDSMTAAIAHGLAHGTKPAEWLRLATAAAALNITRHGLASGYKAAIDALAERIEVERFEP